MLGFYPTEWWIPAKRCWISIVRSGSVIRGSRSRIKGAGSEIRRDPPQFNHWWCIHQSTVLSWCTPLYRSHIVPAATRLWRCWSSPGPFTYYITQKSCFAPPIHPMWWLGSLVVRVLDSDAEGPRFKSQSRRCRVTVLGKLFTPIEQQNW